MSQRNVSRYRNPIFFVAASAAMLACAGLLFSSRFTPPPPPTRPAAASAPAVLAGAARPLKESGSFAQLPLIFEKNEGQTDSRVQFLARGGGYMMFFTGREMVMQFERNKPHARRAAGWKPAPPGPPRESDTPRVPPTVVRMKLQGANPAPEAQGLERLPGLSHYFIGDDPRKWRTNVPQYAKVRYRDVYPGIDMVYYDSHHRLEYDLVVAPGADPHAIRLAFDGVDRIRLDGQGNLVLTVNGRELRQARPEVHQIVGGRVQDVAVRYQIARDTREVTLALAEYDHSRTLTVDPVLDYFTYLGGSYMDFANFITVDPSGNSLITGYTTSPDFLGSLTSPLPGHSAITSTDDAFLVRINAAGTQVLSSTFIGGNGAYKCQTGPTGNCEQYIPGDEGYGIALDSSNNIYLTGRTTSTDFPGPPTTSGFQIHNAGGSDAFLMKLNASASAILYCTYFGGPYEDHGYALALDSNLNAYVTGLTQGSLPAGQSSTVTQPNYGGAVDAFVAKFDSSGTQLLYRTYIGGPGYDFATSIFVDKPSGSAYVLGMTTSSTGMNPVSALQPVYGGAGPDNIGDLFLTKLDTNGGKIYLTYIGGSQDENTSYSCLTVDGQGNAYVAGGSDSATLPGITGSSMQTYNFGLYDAFVVKVDPTGAHAVFTTFLGGSDYDYASGIALDNNHNVFVTGGSYSSDFLSYYPFQPAPGLTNVFVTEIKADGTKPLFSTYFGVPGDLIPSSLAVQQVVSPPGANFYVTGLTCGTLNTVPPRGTTPPLFSNFQGPLPNGCSTTDQTSVYDVFLAKLSNATLVPHMLISGVKPAVVVPLGKAAPRASSSTPQYSGTCTVSNTGQSGANNVTVTVNTNGQILSCNNSAGTCSSGGTSTQCTVPNLNPGDPPVNCTATFTTSSAPGGSCQTNSFTINTNPDPTITPNISLDALDENSNPQLLQVTEDATSASPTTRLAPLQDAWVAGASRSIGVPTNTQYGSDASARPVRYRFGSWTTPSGTVQTTPTSVSITDSASTSLTHFIANFITQYQVVLSPSTPSTPSTCPTATASASPLGDNYYDAGKPLTLTAPVCSGYSLQNWTLTQSSGVFVNTCGSQNPCTITMPPVAAGAGTWMTISANYGNVPATTTSLQSAPNPSTVGQTVNLTATVSPSAAGGTVTFYDGAATLGAIQLSNGTATYSTSALSQGTHNLTASYSGSASYAGSTSNTVPQVVSGQCSSGLATMNTPAPNTTLGGATVTFSWTNACNAQAYWLDVGTSVGQGNIFGMNVGTATSQTVNNIPIGPTVYVQLWTELNNTWTANRYTYPGVVSGITSPAPSSAIGPSANFCWTSVSGADNYWLDVGNSVGQGDISAGATTATCKTVNGLPTDGRTIYVQWWVHLNGAWQTPVRYTYVAGGGGTPSPAPGSVLAGATVTFSWPAVAGADNYWLDVGNAVGQGDISAGATTATSKTVSGLPTDGRTLYVQLWTHLNGSWQTPQQYTYTAANNPGIAQMQSPTPNTVLAGSTVTFSWSAATGADNYWLDVGNSVGHGDISGGATTATSKTVSGLPADGRTIYVQLWTHLNGNWLTPQQYTYTAATGSGIAQMQSPTPGSALTGTSVTFSWSAAAGADNYWLDVGTAVGQGDISAGATTATSKGVAGLPCDGRALYVQLWTHLNGAWKTPLQYTYTACATGLAQITTPAPGSTLAGSTVTFSWTAAAGATAYWLDVGTAVGQGNIFGANVGTALTATVSGIPTTGVPIYAQLWSMIAGTWHPVRYTYTAF